MDLDRVPSIAKYLSVVFLVSWLGRSTVWNFLPIFLEKHISSVFLLGIITALPAIIPLLLDIPVGNLVQKSGEKIVIFLGLFAAILPPALYATAIAPLLVLGKAAEGVVKSLVWNGGWSLSLKSADDDVESEAVSVFLLGVNLALVLGPIIGGFLIASQGFYLTFKLWAFSSILGLLVFYSYVGIERKEGLEQSLEELLHRRTYMDEYHHIKEHWSDLKFPFSLVFLYSIIFSFYWLAIPLLLDKINADYATMGIIFGLAAVPKVFQFIFGNIADHIGKLKTLAFLSLALTPVLVVMNFITNVLLVGVFVFIARTLSSGMSPAVHATFDARVPDEIESEMTGFLELFKHGGTALGPILAGTVASMYSINASFLAAAGVSLLIFAATFRGLWD
ncbi:MFS transporter [Candidatus Nanohaloarchaea archaeon]|nr:MFS transporter [Candidatus Nanohaloarchaea archaeon]